MKHAKHAAVQIAPNAYLVQLAITGTMVDVLKNVQLIIMLIHISANALNAHQDVQNVIKQHAFHVWMIGKSIIKEDVYRKIAKDAMLVRL